MMFQVRSEASALHELASLWTPANSAMRKEITAATHQIDQQLHTDPFVDSESRAEDRRILFNRPLAIIFRVEPDGKTVSVLQVWLFRKRSH
jgi:hypothetical protein